MRRRKRAHLDASILLTLDLSLDGLVLDSLELVVGALASVELGALLEKVVGALEGCGTSKRGQRKLRATRVKHVHPMWSARKGGRT